MSEDDDLPFSDNRKDTEVNQKAAEPEHPLYEQGYGKPPVTSPTESPLTVTGQQSLPPEPAASQSRTAFSTPAAGEQSAIAPNLQQRTPGSNTESGSSQTLRSDTGSTGAPEPVRSVQPSTPIEQQRITTSTPAQASETQLPVQPAGGRNIQSNEVAANQPTPTYRPEAQASVSPQVQSKQAAPEATVPRQEPGQPERTVPTQSQIKAPEVSANDSRISQVRPSEIAGNQPRSVEPAVSPAGRDIPKVSPVIVEPSDNKTHTQPIQQQLNQSPLKVSDANVPPRPISESLTKSDTSTASQSVKPIINSSAIQEQNTGRVLPQPSDSRSIDPRSIQQPNAGSRVEQTNVSGAVAPQKTELQPEAKAPSNKPEVAGTRVEPDRSAASTETRSPADRTVPTNANSDIRSQPDRNTGTSTNAEGRLQPGKQPLSDATGGSDIAQGIRVPAAGESTVSGGSRGDAGGRIPDARIEPAAAISGGTDIGIRGYAPVEKEVIFDPKEEPTDRQIVRTPEEPVSKTPTPAREAEIHITEQFADKESRAELLVAIRKLEQGKTDDQPTRIVDLVNVLSLIEPIKIQQIKDILVKEVVGKGDEKAEQILVKQLMALFPKNDEVARTFKNVKTEIVSVEEETESNKGKAEVVLQLQAMILKIQRKQVDLYKDAAEKFDELKAQVMQEEATPKVDHRRRYIVKEGDTLKSIAKQKLKDALLPDLLLEINRSVITTPIGKPLTTKLVILLPTSADIADYRKRTDEGAS